MANNSLFKSATSNLPNADAVNEAGGRAYKLEPKHALAQIAATGTFGNAFYSTAETQLDEFLKLIDEVDDTQFLAKLAVYAREKAFMKAIPDLLSDAAKGPTVWAAMVRDESTGVEDEFEYSASTWGFQ